MRVKPIPPTLREKRRYLLVRNASWREIMGAMKRNFGDVYTALSRITKIEEGEDYTIVRVRRDFDRIVRAAIALADFGKLVWVERVSGTLKGLRRCK
jgi:RNase P/RNase MRP subunit POP5